MRTRAWIKIKADVHGDASGVENSKALQEATQIGVDIAREYPERDVMVTIPAGTFPIDRSIH